MRLVDTESSWETAGRRLTLHAVSPADARSPFPDVFAVLRPVFDELAPWLSPGGHHARIRSLPGAVIAGHCGNAAELDLLLPDTPLPEAELQAVFAHELHHMARRRHAGYGRTLGEVCTSEAMALWYEACWLGDVPRGLAGDLPAGGATALLADWQTPDFDHDRWFVSGPLGERIAYRLAWRTIQQHIERTGTPLTLADSLTLTADALRPTLEHCNG